MPSFTDYQYPSGVTQSGKFGPSRFFREQRLTLPSPTASFEGLTVIVTGSNTGVGLEAARHIARLNAADLILAVRTISKGEAARDNIKKSCPESKTNIHVLHLDMGSFASVREFADRVTAEFPKIDIAILNAGINTQQWNITKDGWEQMVQVNVLATAYLTLLLLPKIKQSFDKTPGAYDNGKLMPTLVVVSSDVHFISGLKQKKHIDEKLGILNALNNKAESHNPGRYADTKLMEVFFVRELANYLETHGQADDIVLNTVNPGLCKSELASREPGLLGMIIKVAFVPFSLIARTAEVGSRNYLWAATAGKASFGQYIGSCEIQKPAVLVTSEEGKKIQKKVWEEIGEVLTGVDEGVKGYFQ
ncbi:hypothetical protein ABW19_dt0207673 [Dactylella cylindrospora]|nr:hypothetical protein ABW19_dt0207673 [Dactylella cylindrospora]